MYKLNTKNYHKVIPIINQINYNHLFTEMVALNTAQGEIYVDNKEEPTVCFISHQYGMAFLCGNEKNQAFNQSLMNYLTSNKKNKPKYLLVYPMKWESILDNITHLIKTERVNFKYEGNKLENEILVPKHFNLKLIDKMLFHKIDGSVVPKHFFVDEKEFIKHSIGYTLLYDDQIVSTCFASYLSDKILEFGIETTKNFRRKGYSLIPAKALLHYCIQNNYEPMWSCRGENIPSYKVALKLGFKPHTYHPYYKIPE